MVQTLMEYKYSNKTFIKCIATCCKYISIFTEGTSVLKIHSWNFNYTIIYYLPKNVQNSYILIFKLNNSVDNSSDLNII